MTNLDAIRWSLWNHHKHGLSTEERESCLAIGMATNDARWSYVESCIGHLRSEGRFDDLRMHQTSQVTWSCMQGKGFSVYIALDDA